jgi:galactokinase
VTEADGPLDVGRLREALERNEPTAAGAPQRLVRAPGRVNLIGEHTDYNEGFVLPAAIDLETWIASAPSDDERVELTRLDTGERAGFALGSIAERSGEWIDYVAGTAWALGEAGVPLRGLRGVIASSLPISSGLSSSAAIELASAWTLSAEVPPPLPGMLLARTAQRAENEYVGVKSGLMDPFASALGQRDAALLLDCRSLDYRPVRLEGGSHVLVVCDTGSPRRLERSEYNRRRAECERAVATLSAREPSVSSLRDVDEAMLDRNRDSLDAVAYRRALHVVRENGRVLAFEAALAAGDVDEAGALLAASHASLRDLFEVSSPELDTMVEVVGSVPGVAGVRMTGAGFGGCVVGLVRRDAVDTVRRAVAQDYAPRTGLTPRVWAVRAVDGAGLVPEGSRA